MSTHPRRPLRLAAGVFAALLATAGAGCAVNPATGARQLSFIGEGREIEMGRDSDPQIVAAMGLYPDSALQRYVRELGLRLAAVSERPQLPWTIRVLDDPTVNAFALPGGFLYVTRGILAHMGSEAELAGVLGHEVGHVTARHSVNQISRQQLTQIGLGLGMIFVPEFRPFGDLAGAGLQLLSLRYGRDDERESDALGLRYMTALDYDPRELVSVFRMLGRVSGGEGRVPGWLSTHPEPEDRETRIAAAVEGRDLADATVGRERFLRTLDGMIFGDNPREGFFRDGVFHHPELAFRMEFPAGWSTVNQKTAVQALAPGQDALMILELAEAATPWGALAAFASTSGIRTGPSSRQAVGGLEAAAAEFEATTSDGNTFRGRAQFVAHGGQVYSILGYASAARWSGVGPAVRGAQESFAPELDAAVLAVQPARVEIVEIDADLPFADFVARFPSMVPDETVARINQTTVDGVVQGPLAKRVTGGPG